MLELLFWMCLAAGLYPYAGYPLCVALLARVMARSVSRGPIRPGVTVVISAYNEVEHVEATILDKLAQDYPPELLDVMVGSDGSTDGTDEVIRSLAARNPRVSYFRQ